MDRSTTRGPAASATGLATTRAASEATTEIRKSMVQRETGSEEEFQSQLGKVWQNDV